MRHTGAAGHNAFRGDGSQPKARARSAMAQLGFPALGFDRWCITSQLPFPNLFGVLLFKSLLLQALYSVLH
jgi:hypothetical protein